jgi:hypothetical protein
MHLNAFTHLLQTQSPQNDTSLTPENPTGNGMEHQPTPTELYEEPPDDC